MSAREWGELTGVALAAALKVSRDALIILACARYLWGVA